MEVDIEEMLEDAASDGVISCPTCEESMEPDAPACANGHVNPLVAGGFI